MAYHYYAFFLNGKERIFYTHQELDTEEDILEWALRFGFIREEDFEYCCSVRKMESKEVQERNDALYKEWWETHKDDEYLSGKIPPTIGEVQLD